TTATLLNLGVLPEALIRLGRLLRISGAAPKPQTSGAEMEGATKAAAAE
ncbi:MAG: hypothetical protein JSS54_10635, partial [Proteobacteria bacterium]|nr:hypothetical protein [Pseudomonadota bacterium]